MAIQNPITSSAGDMQNVGGKLAAALGRHDTTIPEFLAFLAQAGNEPAIEEIASIADRMPRPVVVPEPKPLLLIALPPIEIPGLERFEVDKRIKVGVDGTVYVSPEFHGDFDGMVEDALPPSTIYPHSNTRDARYSLMREDLGGEKIVRATLGQIAHLAKTGKLLANGKANLFEVLNGRRVARLVNVGWFVWLGVYGWGWNSYPVEFSHEWGAGRQVFSGNSLALKP